MSHNCPMTWAAFETLRDHIALFNECVSLHLNNELRQ